MANPISNIYRLFKAGITLTYYGVTLFPKHIPTPLPVKLMRILLLPFSLLGMVLRAPFAHQTPSERLVTALTKLGPTYIKLGQFLATTPAPSQLRAKCVLRVCRLRTAVRTCPISRRDFRLSASTDCVTSSASNSYAAASRSNVS